MEIVVVEGVGDAVFVVVCCVVVVDGGQTDLLFHRLKPQQQLSPIHWTGRRRFGWPHDLEQATCQWEGDGECAHPMHFFLGGDGIDPLTDPEQQDIEVQKERHWQMKRVVRQ